MFTFCIGRLDCFYYCFSQCQSSASLISVLCLVCPWFVLYPQNKAVRCGAVVNSEQGLIIAIKHQSLKNIELEFIAYLFQPINMSVEDTKDSVLVEDIAVLNSQSDITSFIEALENKEYLKNCLNPFDSISEEDVLSNISSFTLWLSSTMESMLLAGKILSVNKCLKHFNALLQAINRIRKILNTVKSKQKTKQSFICTVCNQEIQQYQKGSTWDPLQEHEHIEQQFVTFVNEGTIPWLLKTHSQSILLEMNADEQVNGQASTDIENSVEDDTETNFKFNFKPVYDDEVKNIVYPSNLMEKVFRIDSISDYTIQIEYNTIACCLLCRTNVPMTESNILDHVKGSKHLKLTNNGINIESLNVYHSIWPKLNPIYQWHQIYFLPYDILKMMCKLCNVSVNYDQIESHLKEDRHEKEFRFMCNSKVVEKNAYLMSKQLILYKSFNTVLQQNNPVVNPVENGISESSTSASKPPVNTPGMRHLVILIKSWFIWNNKFSCHSCDVTGLSISLCL